MANMFYENQLIGISYAEPYAGGAGLALRLLFEGYVDKIYINDYDRAIYSFWVAVLERPDDFCDWIRTVQVSVENWYKYKEVQVNYIDSDMFELAKATFFLNRTNISGVINGGIIGGQSQNGKYKIDARFNKEELINRIQKIKTLKDRISISNLDGIKFIKELNRKREDIFIYLDPPYYQKGADLYMNFYTKDDHTKLAKFVGGMRQKWMVSYDYHRFILNLYAVHSKVAYRLSQAASNRVGDEILVFSDQIFYLESLKALNEAKII